MIDPTSGRRTRRCHRRFETHACRERCGSHRKTVAVAGGGALAGLSGVLYASWGNYVSPDVFSLASASLPVVWVSVGGRKTLLGAIVATIGVQYVSNFLSGELAFVIVGSLLVVVILFMPEGAVPRIATAIERVRGNRQGRDVSDAATEVADR
jgi:branched-chain amino acid transport system permease protein